MSYSPNPSNPMNPMNTVNQIKATVYCNNEKVCDSYFQALPRIGEIITISDVFDVSYKVLDIEHKTFPISSTSNNSYNMNHPRTSEISLLCTK